MRIKADTERSVADPGSGFRDPVFHTGSRIRISNLTQKNGFYALGNIIRVVHPGSSFLPIPDSGSMVQKGTGTRIRNTDRTEALGKRHI